jgi:hypothetical protein
MTPWPESGSELYRQSDRLLSAKLVSTFADRRSHVVSVMDPYGRILGFLDLYNATETHKVEQWQPIQILYLLLVTHMCFTNFPPLIVLELKTCIVNNGEVRPQLHTYLGT